MVLYFILTALWMAVFEWVAAKEIVCKDSGKETKGGYTAQQGHNEL